MVEYNFPQELLDYFSKIALRNVNTEGQIETLALALGTKENDVFEVKELVFPSQKGSSSHVLDNGKLISLFFNFSTISFYYSLI